ncbi:hypothetical protein [Allomuricauda sp. SCSIO 65647]|uniref:hypothetical protein n=1 Tax=Allomuricauda sp. SCSIO 65647 TaxID=2908843 RepID=UPI001F273296|nr:hypothetical protein [Muricauda sp. SCSIO 65647]UJH68663.1 hypothetical protein L0P89_05470 [Muricauda sp. SCSIO 65647]
MIKRKTNIIFALGIFLVVLGYIFVKFIEFDNINSGKNDCLVNDFNIVFRKENSIKLGEVYNFSQIFNCRNWDEVIIVGGRKANRTIIYIKEGVALPKIDYRNRLQGVLLFYFVKDGKLISSPISFYDQDFLYFEDFNYFDYVSLKKKEAIFKCVKLETIGADEEILTFELSD